MLHELKLHLLNIFCTHLVHITQALCDARAVPGLVHFAGAYHMPDSGQIAIILEYMDGGSLQVGCCCVAIRLLAGGLLIWCEEAPRRWAAVVLR
jgi:hypothetical protein